MIKGVKSACSTCFHIRMQVRLSSKDSTKSSDNNQSAADIKSAWRSRRNAIFENERIRQENDLGRIEKVMVKYKPWDPDAKPIQMRMNRHLSAPYHCSRHVSETMLNLSALALVDGNPWDLQKPFENDCELELLTMDMAAKTQAVNKAFWRTCSFVLGSMIDLSFKDEIPVYLYSFPPPNLHSGSFVYDAILDLPEWKPSDAELRAMSAAFVKTVNSKQLIERLEVSESVALDMFQDNPFKSKQIPNVASSNEGKVTLYRIGEHIDISRGPMVGNTGIIGKATVAAVHKVESSETDRMYRFQGVALPRTQRLNHVAWGILEKSAKMLNTAVWSPIKKSEEDVEEIKSNIAVKN